jgi:hypothetical protein
MQANDPLPDVSQSGEQQIPPYNELRRLQRLSHASSLSQSGQVSCDTMMSQSAQ